VNHVPFSDGFECSASDERSQPSLVVAITRVPLDEMPSTQTRESLSPTAHEPRGRSEGSLSLLPMCVCRGSILREEFGYILGSGYRLRKRSAAPPKVAARGRIAVRAAVLAFTDTPARSIQPNLFPLRVLCAFTAFARLQQNLDNTSSPPSSAPQSAQDTSQSSTGKSAGGARARGLHHAGGINLLHSAE